MFRNRERIQENRERILITGVSGLLGNNLAYYFRDKLDVLGLYNDHPVHIDGIEAVKCDLSNPGLFRDILEDLSPSTIIHCASLANVDQCESDKEMAHKANVIFTKSIVDAIKDKTIKMVYISSDSVYDGIKGNFTEQDDISPQNYYGLTKYMGELEALKMPDTLIFRTNIFGWNIQDKESIGEWVLHNLKKKQSINGFNDVYFSTIYTMELARVIDISIEKQIKGIFNCGSSDSCSKYEFAVKIAGFFNLDPSLIKPVSIDGISLKAKRGKVMTMNIDKIQKTLNYKLPKISKSIESFNRDYLKLHSD
jgi:dTDP-4-dehydrorhamnose reductase